MLKKRLVGVITVLGHWAVQSFGYQRYLPLGKPHYLAENLDRWGVDEILVQDIRRSALGLGPNFDVIERLAACQLSTPLVYAGGIRHQADAVAVVRGGIERVCIDALLHRSPDQVAAIAQALGSQAVIASLPARKDDHGNWGWYDYLNRRTQPSCAALHGLIEEQLICELLVIDSQHEGQPNGFDPTLVDYASQWQTPLIVFGGISEAAQLESLLQQPWVAAAGLGNFLNYREQAVQQYKEQLIAAPIRPASYWSRQML